MGSKKFTNFKFFLNIAVRHCPVLFISNLTCHFDRPQGGEISQAQLFSFDK